MGDLVKRSAGQQLPAVAEAVPEEIWIDHYLDQKQSEVARYWNILLKRKRLVAFVALLVFAAGAVYTFTAPRIYSARVNLQIEPEQNVLGYQEAYAAAVSDPTYLRTQSQVLRSEVLGTRVVNRLKLVSDPSQTVATARWFASQVVVTPVEGTQVLNVSFRSEDPKFAATAINTLADEYLNYGFASKREVTTLAKNYVEEELAKAELRLEQSEKELVDYGRARGILLPTQDNNAITQKLVDLNSEMTKVDTQILANNYEALKATTVENFPQRLKTPVMAELDRNRAALEQKLATATQRFGPKWPEVEALAGELAQVNKQLGEERAAIIAQEKASYDVEMAHRARLGSAIDDQTQRADQLAKDSIEFNLLKRKVDADRKMHEGLLNRMKEMDVSVGLKALNVHVIDRGYVPTLPVLPNVPLNLALALTLGVILGAAVACSVEFFDQTVKSPEDVEQRLGMPFLAAIPAFSNAWKEGSRGHLVAVNNSERPSSTKLGDDAAMYWESYRSLRTSILFSSPQHRPQTILVTSALPGEGKSTTAMNLAISLAQTGAHTLLVEVDMRKPKLADVFNIPPRGGLSGYLAGVTELSAELHQTAVPNLCVVPSGPIPPNPPELLGSARMTRGLSLMRRHFQYVVFDGPPVLPVSDAAIVATQVDGVVLVVDGTGSATHATKARNLLRSVNAKLLGALVNKAQVERLDFYQYSYSDYVNSDVVPQSQKAV